MKKFTALALVAGLSATGAAQAQDNYTLCYDPSNGNVSLITTGTMISYVLEAPTGQTPFVGANHNLTISMEEIAPGFFFKTGLATSANNQIFESSSLDIINRVGGKEPYGAGTYDIGNILAPGLDLAGLQAAVSKVNSYTVDTGQASKEFDLKVVPEPTSLALLGLGGLLVARRRRG